MSFSRKTILGVLAVNAAAIGLLGTFLYLRLSQSTEESLVHHYQSKIRSLALTLMQLEASADLVSVNAATALREIEKRQGLPEGDALRAIAKRLNVTNIFATDAQGKYIRSTNKPVAEFTHTLYDMCADYRKMITGTSDLEQTPIIPSSDLKLATPFKYTMVPNHNRTKVLEVTVDLSFLSTTLGTLAAEDSSIESLGLYAPTGRSLGAIYGTEVKESAAPAFIQNRFAKEGFYRSGNSLVFHAPIAARDQTCCECKTKGVAVGDTDQYFYLLRASVSRAGIVKAQNRLLLDIGVLGFASLLLSFFLAHALGRRLSTKLNLLDQEIERVIADRQLTHRLPVEGQDEFARLGRNFNAMLESLETSQKETVKTQRLAAYAELADQVVHDIASPLVALGLATENLDALPENRRSLIQAATLRIKQILNSLTTQKRAIEGSILDLNGERKPEPLLALLESILAEKRIQYLSMTEVKIAFELTPEAYGLFCTVNAGAFKRVISNLINNAVESLPEQRGQVGLRVQAADGMAQLTLSDDGCGIAPEILLKLTDKGQTFGKSSGSGLGLYHARSVVESAGGKIALTSQVGKGTQVVLTLPLCPPAPWFPRALELDRFRTVAVLDDDESIHQVWKNRLHDSGVSLQSFSSSESFKQWVGAHDSDSVLYLVDQDLRGEAVQGIDVVEHLGIAARSLLVTTKFEDESTLRRCQLLGVRLLPKSLAGVIPLK